MMAYLDGTLSPALAAEAEAHEADCAECRAETTAFRSLGDDLRGVGAAISSTIPDINLVADVLAKAAASAGQAHPAPLWDVEDATIFAYIEGELDGFTRAKIDRLRASEPKMDKELSELEVTFSGLMDLGAAASPELPEIDVTAGVLSALRGRERASSIERGALAHLPPDVELAFAEFVEGDAPAELEERLRAYAELHPELSESLEEYAALHDALYALGEIETAATPRIDIASEVLDAVKRERKAGNAAFLPTSRAARTTSPRHSKSLLWPTLALAAAASLLFGLYLNPALFGLGDGGQATARERAHLAAVENTSPMDMGGFAGLVEGEIDSNLTTDAEGASAEEGATAAEDAEPAEDAASGVGALSLDDLLELRQKSLEDDVMALARLARLSSLSENEARKLAATPGISTETLLGAAQFLPPGEAITLLKGAIANNPEDPYLRKALAKAYAENGQMELAEAELDAWRAMDNKNGLPSYLEARMAFESGDMAGGLALLEEASRFESASNYSAQSARYRQSALHSNGFGSDASNFLAGSTAGTPEYKAMQSLAGELLAQGDALRDAGNYAGAQQVYMGVYNLGAQLSNSAQLGNDFAAAYDVQSAALNALVTLSRIFAAVDLNVVNALIDELNAGIAALAEFFSSYNQIFSSGDLQRILALIAATLGGNQLGFF